MFTGIIRELGTVARVQRSRGLVRLLIDAPQTAARAERLDSVAINGVCLSVVDIRQGCVLFDMIPETQHGTTLASLQLDDRVNVEPSLTLSDRLGGHILFGHVDGVGTVMSRRQRAGELVLEMALPRALKQFVVPKGPVAIDGVSVTVGQVRGLRITLHLIPETLRQTTFGARALRDRVNVEVDYLAKLVWQFVHPH